MSDISALKDRILLEDLAQRLGMTPAMDGARYMKFVCPFHPDVNPSFIIDKVSQYATCYAGGCVANRRLDQLGLIRLVRHCSEDEAIDVFYQMVGEPRPADTLQDHLRRVMDRLHHNIGDNTPADFFIRRGVSVDALHELMVGYSSSYAWFQGIVTDVPMDVQVKLEFTQPHMFNNAIIYPQFDGLGRISGYRSRPFASSQKYYSTSKEFPLKSSRLYGLHLVKGSQIVLVEGPNDVLALRANGVKGVCGLNGNKTKDVETFLTDRGFSDIVFIADGEEAGKGAMMAAPPLIRVNQVPDGLDPDELVAQRGLMALATLINQARFPFELKLESRMASAPPDLAGKIVAIKAIARDISEGMPRIVLARVQDRIAQMLGVPKDDVDLIFELVDFDTSPMEAKIVSHMAVGGALSNDIKAKILPWMFADPNVRKQFEELLGGRSLPEQVPDRGLLTEGDVDRFAEIARRRRLKRTLTKSASRIMNMAATMDDTVGTIMKEVYDASYEDFQIWETRDQLLLGVNNAIERHDHQGKLLGVSFGKRAFPTVDDICQGLRPRAFFVLAASQGSGKSALGLEWAMNMAYRDQVPVLWISLEMSELDISSRILSKLTRVSTKRIMNGDLSDEQISVLSRSYLEHKGPLYMVSSSGMTVAQIVALTRKMRETKGIQAVFIDYIQLIRGTASLGANSYERMGAVSGELKNSIAMSSKIGVPVVAIAQLNRQAASAKVSISEHIAESYRVAQDADAVITLKKRTADQKLADKKSGEDNGDITLNVDKNRSGEDRKFIPLRFYRNHMTICEVESELDVELQSLPGGGMI
jgi:replicative DNA helicase